MTAILGVVSDAELVLLARAGDRDAFSQLFDRHCHLVAAACRSKARCSADVDDAVQEGFARALANLDQLREPAQFGAWVRAIAVRAVLDQHRASQRVVVIDNQTHADLADAAPQPDESVERREGDAAIRTALDKLGERDRRALYLRHIAEAPVAAVADELGLTEGSTRVMLTRARERLRMVATSLPVLIPLPWRRWFRDHIHTATPAIEALSMVVAVGIVSALGQPAQPAQAAPPDKIAVEAVGAEVRPQPERRQATKTAAPERSRQRRTHHAAVTPAVAQTASDTTAAPPGKQRPRKGLDLSGMKDSVQVRRDYPNEEESDEIIDVTVFSEDDETSTRLYADQIDEATGAVEELTDLGNN